MPITENETNTPIRKRVTTSFRLSCEHRLRLAEAAEKEGISQRKILERAIDAIHEMQAA